MSLSFDEFYVFAERATDAVSASTLSGVEHSDASLKDDKSVVTKTDFSIEKKIRNRIRESYPTHNISGEEYEFTNNNSEYTWTIDPIDGTVSYLHGVPLFGILLGLSFNEIPLYGSIRLPMLRNDFVAGDSSVCLINGQQARAKEFTSFEDCLMLTTDIERVRKSRYSMIYDGMIEKGSLSRTWGDCFGYYLLCSGKADLMMDLDLKDCDILPLIPILKGAGAKIIKLDGTHNNIVACVAELADTVESLMP